MAREIAEETLLRDQEMERVFPSGDRRKEWKSGARASSTPETLRWLGEAYLLTAKRLWD
jgi:hypothetical protein